MASMFLGAWLSAFAGLELVLWRSLGPDTAVTAAVWICAGSTILFGVLWWIWFNEEFGN